MFLLFVNVISCGDGVLGGVGRGVEISGFGQNTSMLTEKLYKQQPFLTIKILKSNPSGLSFGLEKSLSVGGFGNRVSFSTSSSSSS